MSAQDNAIVAQKHYALLNQRQLDEAVATIVAEDVECTTVPFGATFHGRAGYRLFLESWVSALPDSRLEITRLVTDGNDVAVEFVAWSKQTGPFAAAPDPTATREHLVALPFCEMIQVRDGRIVGIHTYFDTATMMRQLGLWP